MFGWISEKKKIFDIYDRKNSICDILYAAMPCQCHYIQFYSKSFSLQYTVNISSKYTLHIYSFSTLELVRLLFIYFFFLVCFSLYFLNRLLRIFYSSNVSSTLYLIWYISSIIILFFLMQFAVFMKWWK